MLSIGLEGQTLMSKFNKAAPFGVLLGGVRIVMSWLLQVSANT